jgi:hypothetical protein
MLKGTGISIEKSNGSPTEQIQLIEFVEGVLKAGSLISILENKKINSTTLFTLLLENKQYQDFFIEITASNSFREAVYSLLYLYPSLVKSKITKSSIKKINASRNSYRAGKDNL